MAENNLLGKHLQFQLFGEYVGITSFPDESGTTKHYLKLDYFGGSHSVELDDDEATRWANLPVGCDARLAGFVSWKTGTPRLQVDSFAFADDKGFKEIVLEERLAGSLWYGIGQVIRRWSFNMKDGTTRYNVGLNVMGGPFNVTCSEAVFAGVPAVEKYVTCRGRLRSILAFDRGLSRPYVRLECLLDQAAEFDFAKFRK